MSIALDMDEATLQRFLALSEARTDARELSPVALLREARLAGIRGIADRDTLVEQVARAWVGLEPDLRHG